MHFYKFHNALYWIFYFAGLRLFADQVTFNICDRISENGSKSHIFISLYLLIIAWNLLLKLSKLFNKYSENTYG